MVSILYKANSLLGFVVAISLVSWLIGAAVNNQRVIGIAEPVFIIFAFFWVLFLVLSLARNVKSLFR